MTDSPQSPGSSTPGDPAGPPPPPPPPPAYGTTSDGAQAYGGTPAPPPAYGTPPAAPPVYGSTPPGAVSPSDQRMWAIFAHIGGIFVSFLVPLVIWLVYKDRDDFIRDQSAEALNWQITLFIAGIIGVVTIILLVGFLILAAVGIVGIVFGVLAALAANRGERYRYPFALRLVK